MASRIVRLGRKLLPRRLAAVASRWLNLPARVAALESGLAFLGDRILHDRHGAAEEAFDLRRHELKVFSQNGEDGVLLALFSLIGGGERTFVEFGCGDGSEFNSLNLLLNWDWRGVLLEADTAKAAAARRLLDRRLGRRAGEVDVVQALLTRDNVDGLLAAKAREPEPDLLSIDVDGNDYWLWRSITTLRPRVVVVEYNAAFGPERSLTVPYDPGFDAQAHHPSGSYFGASLSALARLGAAKGYVLIGCESHGVNAFFVRRDLAADASLAELSPAAAWRPLSPRHTELDSEERWAAISHLPFVEVPAEARSTGD